MDGLSSNTLYATKNIIISNVPSTVNTKLSGYYYNRINCFDINNNLIETSGILPNTVDLYLSGTQVTFWEGVANQELPTSNFYNKDYIINYELDDIISLVNGSYYGACAKVINIDGNKLTLGDLSKQFADDLKTNFNYTIKSDGVTVKTYHWWRNADVNDNGDYSIYVIEKSLSGVVDLANENSLVVGNSSQSYGNYSYTRGTAHTVAAGPYATAIGYEAHALNYASFSLGQYTRAYGLYSFAQGHCTSAILKYSFAHGNYTYASGIASHAEGYGTSAINNYSHAEGRNTCTYGLYSHAEGSLTNTYGNYSHAEGNLTNAYGSYSFTAGNATVASGNYSFAIGKNTQTNNSYTVAEGLYTIANGQYQHVFGKYNQPNLTDVIIIGNGTSNGNRTNAYTLDWYGNSYQSGVISAANFYNTTLSSLISLDNYVLKTDAVILNSLTVQNGTVKNGTNNTTIGVYSHAEGKDTTAYTRFSHAEGNGTQTGDSTIDPSTGVGGQHSEGMRTYAIGAYSHAEGYGTSAMYQGSHSQGQGTITNQNYQHVAGRYNVPTSGKAFIIGGGTKLSNKKNIYELDWDGNAFYTGNIQSNDQYLNARVYNVGTVSTSTFTANYNNGDFYNVTFSAATTLLVTNIPLGCALIIRAIVSSNINITFGSTTVISEAGTYYITFNNPNGTIELIGKAIKLS